MDGALIVGGWVVAASVTAFSAVYIACLEHAYGKLRRYAESAGATLIAQQRATDFWKRVATDCQEGRAEMHKKTVVRPLSPRPPRLPNEPFD